jgi:hypothetical protein
MQQHGIHEKTKAKKKMVPVEKTSLVLHSKISACPESR